MTEDIKAIKVNSTPVIHLNGSSRDSLINEWAKFSDAIDEAFLKFPHESFHGRNHYVKPEGEDLALRAKSELLETLSNLMDLSEGIIEELTRK